MERLINHCVDYIKPRLTLENSLQALHSALEIDHPIYVDACLSFVASNFSQYTGQYRRYLCELEPSVIYQVLDHPNLSPQFESEVLAFVRLYSSGRELSPQEVSRLYSTVRMHFLACSTLADIGDDPRVPHDLVRKAMSLRLRLMDSPNLVGQLPPDQHPRRSYRKLSAKFDLPYDDPSYAR